MCSGVWSQCAGRPVSTSVGAVHGLVHVCTQQSHIIRTLTAITKIKQNASIPSLKIYLYITKLKNHSCTVISSAPRKGGPPDAIVSPMHQETQPAVRPQFVLLGVPSIVLVPLTPAPQK